MYAQGLSRACAEWAVVVRRPGAARTERTAVSRGRGVFSAQHCNPKAWPASFSAGLGCLGCSCPGQDLFPPRGAAVRKIRGEVRLGGSWAATPVTCSRGRPEAEAEPGGYGLGGDVTELIEVQKSLPLDFFPSIKRFDKEDFRASGPHPHPRRPQTECASLGLVWLLCSHSSSGEGVSVQDLRVLGLLHCASGGQGAILQDAFTLHPKR